jgi:hypothetical protein
MVPPGSLTVLADALTGSEWGILGAFITFVLAVGAGFWKIIDRFLKELGDERAAREAMRAAMKEEGTSNRDAVTQLEATFSAKVTELVKEFRDETQRVTERQFGLAKDGLGASQRVETELGVVKLEVGEVKRDVAEVRKEVHEVKTVVERIAPPDPKSRPRGGGNA